MCLRVVINLSPEKEDQNQIAKVVHISPSEIHVELIDPDQPREMLIFTKEKWEDAQTNPRRHPIGSNCDACLSLYSIPSSDVIIFNQHFVHSIAFAFCKQCGSVIENEQDIVIYVPCGHSVCSNCAFKELPFDQVVSDEFPFHPLVRVVFEDLEEGSDNVGEKRWWCCCSAPAKTTSTKTTTCYNYWKEFPRFESKAGLAAGGFPRDCHFF